MFIQNRHWQRIAVLVEATASPKGLAFVMHGLSGFKEQDHVRLVADTFRAQEYTVVRFDTTNSFGESDGTYEQATVTNYFEDLEDVIAWAAQQSWYREPFVLTGHSLGALCTTLFAEQYPEKVAALAPVSLPVSGAATLQAMEQNSPEELKSWRETGWQEKESASRPGVMKRLPWSHMENRLQYDVMPRVAALTMPVLLVVGADDPLTTPEHIRQFYAALSCSKRFELIEDAAHNFRTPEQLKRLKEIFEEWTTSFN